MEDAESEEEPDGPLAIDLEEWEVKREDGGYVPKWMPLGRLYQRVYKTHNPAKFCKDKSWLKYLGLPVKKEQAS